MCLLAKKENHNAGLTERKIGMVRDFAIDGLNTSKGLAAFGGNISNYKRVLDIFQRDSITKIEDVEKYLRTGDIKSYVVTVHALRGSCVGIGAEELSQKASDLEAAGRRGDLLFLEKNTGKFLIDLESLSVKLKNALVPPETAVSLDNEKLFIELTKLGHAIEKMSPMDIRASIEALYPYATAKGIGMDVEKILDNVLTGDYDEATRVIDLMLRGQ